MQSCSASSSSYETVEVFKQKKRGRADGTTTVLRARRARGGTVPHCLQQPNRFRSSLRLLPIGLLRCRVHHVTLGPRSPAGRPARDSAVDRRRAVCVRSTAALRHGALAALQGESRSLSRTKAGRPSSGAGQAGPATSLTSDLIAYYGSGGLREGGDTLRVFLKFRGERRAAPSQPSSLTARPPGTRCSSCTASSCSARGSMEQANWRQTPLARSARGSPALMHHPHGKKVSIA